MPDINCMELKGEQYHRTVRQGYLEQAKSDPNRHLVIDATQEEDPVFEDLIRALQQKLAGGDLV